MVKVEQSKYQRQEISRSLLYIIFMKNQNVLERLRCVFPWDLFLMSTSPTCTISSRITHLKSLLTN